MSSPRADSLSVASSPSPLTPSSSFHTPHQSFSSAEGFEEIQVNSPSPRSAGTVEPLDVSPSTPTGATANPAPTTLPPSFQDRHPTVTRTLATCAASIAWFACTASSLPLYMLATPVRLFGTALSLISPTLGVSFTKSTPFKILAGELGKLIALHAQYKQREDLVLIGALELCSLGVSGSAVNAYDLGQTTFKKTQGLITDHLSNAKQRRALEAAQATERAAILTPATDLAEDQATQRRIDSAKPVSEYLTEMQSNHNDIQVTQWKAFEVTQWKAFESKGIDTKPLSALLTKMNEGIESEQRRIRNELPSNATAEEQSENERKINNIQPAVIERIADVLIKLQDSPEITKQVCKIAEERGLASCSDRTATAWLAVEDYVSTAVITQQIQQLIKNPTPSYNDDIQQAISSLLTLEHKKHVFEQLKHHLDKDRDTLKKASLTGSIDYIEVLLHVYNLVQQANPTALRELPYKNFHPGLGESLLQKEAKHIVRQMNKEKTQPSLFIRHVKTLLTRVSQQAQQLAKPDSFITYLQTSDAWATVFHTIDPTAKKQATEIAAELTTCIKLLDDIPFSSKNHHQNIVNVFDGFRRIHIHENPTLDQEPLITDKATHLQAAETQLNAIVQANTPDIAEAQRLLTQIQNQNEDLFDRLVEVAMGDFTHTASDTITLSATRKEVLRFLETFSEHQIPDEIIQSTMNNIVADFKKPEMAPARTGLKQAYLSIFHEDASTIIDAFKLLAYPDNKGLTKFTEEKVRQTFPKPVILRKTS